MGTRINLAVAGPVIVAVAEPVAVAVAVDGDPCTDPMATVAFTCTATITGPATITACA